ncbi:1-acyl-sn-glycerol-3-phosphate acyltransferase [Streptoalloteichus tenebrarius]|uniref:1-acyl-sn-glycerol-3-phosphate acyltransferase n=1 Tax=Streptoalloteichus tenebrarius (strain ATCC 17920 / DSM 40477 / JCM 4838 / CBS 697.72 / NBRC 16177 / NCIMB 11028 / NRRL B-12390 / A12253. 1 / ISP 5477) TaxID=1933 RepID=A0ABT1I3X9_STRSD|nr:lysophospholipid acyltransferase family protein [Streptoalloteichus tenebrarius]MCP2262488.1 1-acyl-sn-glycerol-3-phosphate acyltransferase [Streptoalloteichus tenebrarius]BFF01543.1 lysophospholipid acyltransferase family protein [Streptoalloteichus tenebrarius]
MFYWVLRRLLGAIVRWVYRPTIEGLENVPAEGPVILAPNHLSFADSLVIPLVVPRQVSFLAKAEYFTGRGPKGWLTRWFFTTMGMVPVERGNGRAAKDSLDTALEILAEGRAFGIYPEGTRSQDGQLHRGHVGVARLALASGAPVVPVGLIGTDQLQPVGTKVPRVRPVTIRFGKPLDFSRYEGVGNNLPMLRAVTDQIMYSILELSGQDYVDRYEKRPDAA